METEIVELESKGLLRDNFYFPGREINILGFNFKVGGDLKGTAINSLNKLTEYIKDRIKPWEIVSKSYNERKILANTLLISKVNYICRYVRKYEQSVFVYCTISLGVVLYQILSID